ncbi:MAG: glycoside hydrolase family 88 protein [Bacteroidales bacterium]|nr:glycoside hydrolase family 88 protein [Bacteroidales bacterium]MCM1146529.1 glycoside hydrolase family 88 protein [Bacteroidales bacterium]MCM1205921.1 glycoside hydrolase family 88 protein [Bacillota bacterium]
MALASAVMHAQKDINVREIAGKIADRIIASTSYDFKNTKTGEVHKSVKNMPLSMDIKVNSKYNNWHYTNGVTNIALLELADKTGRKDYERYVLRNMDFVFNEGNLPFFRRQYDKALEEGGWYAVRKLSWHMIFRGKRLDDNGPMGASLIDLYMRHKDKAFFDYIQSTDEHLRKGEPRLSDGTIARIWPHVNTIWADDAFMAVSFLSRMGEMTGDNSYFDDAARQIVSYDKHLWCPEKQIYYHCHHTDNGEHGVAHWSRANGWMFMAQADLLQRMPENHPMRGKVLEIFRKQASGVARYQGNNGLWHQLLDKEDSYEEITGTAMFVFGIARGVKNGWLHPDFIYVAEQGLKGMMTKISTDGDVTAICTGTGIMPSVTYYYNRPQLTNDPMGEGPVLRALTEMIDAPQYTEIKAEEQYDKITVNGTH